MLEVCDLEKSYRRHQVLKKNILFGQTGCLRRNCGRKWMWKNNASVDSCRRKET